MDKKGNDGTKSNHNLSVNYGTYQNRFLYVLIGKNHGFDHGLYMNQKVYFLRGIINECRNMVAIGKSRMEKATQAVHLSIVDTAYILKVSIIP